MFRRGRIKKVSGHIFFYEDKNYDFEFYYKFTKDNDLTIMAYDVNNGTYREFILDDVIVRSMFEAVDGKEITRDHRFINDKMDTPSVAKDYIEAGFTMIKKTGDSRFANVAVLVKLGDFGKDKPNKSFILRRVVYNQTLVIGLDTLALPLNAVKSFVKKMEKMFKAEREITAKGEK